MLDIFTKLLEPTISNGAGYTEVYSLGKIEVESIITGSLSVPDPLQSMNVSLRTEVRPWLSSTIILNLIYNTL